MKCFSGEEHERDKVSKSVVKLKLQLTLEPGKNESLAGRVERRAGLAGWTHLI